MPGSLQDFTSIFTGIDEPDVKGELVVYDPRFYNKQSKLFKDWRVNRDTVRQGYSDWLTAFKGSEPEYAENIGKENEFTKWLRDGGFSAQNAGLRTRERAADEAGLKNALDFAGNNANAAKLYFGGSTGTSSSADYARRLASGNRIASEFAGRDVARERADKTSEINIKLATEGRINANLDKLINRKLLPGQLSTAELNELTAALNAIGSGTQYGAQPKFWEDKTVAQRFGAFAQGVGDTYYGGGARAGAYQPLTQPAGGQAYVPQQAPSAYQSYAYTGPQSYVGQNPTGGYGGYGVGYGQTQGAYAPAPTTASGYPNAVSYDASYAPATTFADYSTIGY